jgi:hypothetical protein
VKFSEHLPASHRRPWSPVFLSLLSRVSPVGAITGATMESTFVEFSSRSLRPDNYTDERSVGQRVAQQKLCLGSNVLARAIVRSEMRIGSSIFPAARLATINRNCRAALRIAVKITGSSEKGVVGIATHDWMDCMISDEISTAETNPGDVELHSGNEIWKHFRCTYLQKLCHPRRHSGVHRRNLECIRTDAFTRLVEGAVCENP